MDVDPIAVATVAALTYAINVPFGYWRAYAKRRSQRLEWFAAIHLPVPIIYLARITAGAPLKLLPLFVAAFFLGQYTGGRIHGYVHKCTSNAGRCLICDIISLDCSTKRD